MVSSTAHLTPRAKWLLTVVCAYSSTSGSGADRPYALRLDGTSYYIVFVRGDRTLTLSDSYSALLRELTMRAGLARTQDEFVSALLDVLQGSVMEAPFASVWRCVAVDGEFNTFTHLSSIDLYPLHTIFSLFLLLRLRISLTLRIGPYRGSMIMHGSMLTLASGRPAHTFPLFTTLRCYSNSRQDVSRPARCCRSPTRWHSPGLPNLP